MQTYETVGYCAVIFPKLDFWQGYFIIDNDLMRINANQAKIVSLMTAAMANPYGALQAVMAEAAIEGKEMAVGAAALALHTKDRPYFYVVADKQPQGIRTSLHELSANNVDEVRQLIVNLPEVIGITKRLRGKIGARDGQGRNASYH